MREKAHHDMISAVHDPNTEEKSQMNAPRNDISLFLDNPSISHPSDLQTTEMTCSKMSQPTLTNSYDFQVGPRSLKPIIQ